MTHTTYTGGYYSLKAKLVKTGIHKHTSALEDPVSDTMLAAVNAVQKTRWRVNPFILEVMSSAFHNGDHIAGLPPAEDAPLPPALSEETWLSMTDEQRAEHKLELSRIHGDNARRRGKREAAGRKLALARDLVDQPVIYFPHALDFRGRAYPLPQDLTPQGDDVSKSLLMFADGKPCGLAGMRWLLIALANAAGQDKLSFDDRVQWVKDNDAQIVQSVADPLEYRWWASEEFDSPWVFLALAQEYINADRYGPALYPCHVPVHIDATCSGIQHLSALGRDPIGGRATNLINTGKREDLYTEVAENVKVRVANDAVKANTVAQAWAGNVKRTTVKRAVMTTPYGVTENGIRDQLIADKHCEGLEGSRRENANYLKDVIVDALESTVVSAKEIMGYFQDVARALGTKNIPLTWQTPAGMKVRQSYFRLSHSQIRTLYGKVSLWDEQESQGLEVRDQALAAAPNVVHSLDSAHLALTVVAARDDGIEHFALIHDSYGTHACNVERLGKILREEFVKMYSGDWLEVFERQVQEYAESIELPPRPRQGTLDLTQVLDSPYFFS